MRIAVVSDAWAPQVNGVVRTLRTTVAELRARGHVVETITPDMFRTIPCPSYPEIRLAIGAGRKVGRILASFDPQAIHIATEGPLGWAARRWCLDHEAAFTTSFHTRFPDYVAVRTGLSPRLFWPLLRRFHSAATRVMVATDSLAGELARNGIAHTHRWSRGVDLALFSPAAPPLPALTDLPRPLQLYVGRVAPEKNVAAFLDAAVPGTKIVVGDGPARDALEQRYPGARFLGALHGAELAGAYAAADVFVFPSRTDTFGLVMIEALASGTPVAAFPVPGPNDIVGSADARVGVLDVDLAEAIRQALTLDRASCAEEGSRYTWARCTDQFAAGLVAAQPNMRAAA
jgi:glycosyltransferase involved in cell wall biosynthesis